MATRFCGIIFITTLLVSVYVCVFCVYVCVFCVCVWRVCSCMCVSGICLRVYVCVRGGGVGAVSMYVCVGGGGGCSYVCVS